MALEYQAQKPAFGMVAKILHWGFVVLFIYGIIKQVDNVAQMEDPGFLRFEILFACVFLFVVVARFLYMHFIAPATALPDDTHPAQKLAAKAVHLSMYAALAGIAITGLIIAAVFALGFREGAFLLEAAIGLHEFTLSASYFLIGLHVAAAIYHRFLGDGVWDAMVPFWRERKKDSGARP